jgi:hypothetical protein
METKSSVDQGTLARKKENNPIKTTTTSKPEYRFLNKKEAHFL